MEFWVACEREHCDFYIPSLSASSEEEAKIKAKLAHREHDETLYGLDHHRPIIVVGHKDNGEQERGSVVEGEYRVLPSE